MIVYFVHDQTEYVYLHIIAHQWLACSQVKPESQEQTDCHQMMLRDAWMSGWIDEWMVGWMNRWLTFNNEDFANTSKIFYDIETNQKC